jgi:hypothetical protein
MIGLPEDFVPSDKGKLPQTGKFQIVLSLRLPKTAFSGESFAGCLTWRRRKKGNETIRAVLPKTV